MTTYTIQTQEYVIHDRPIEEHPLHRIQHEGADVLSIKELLQVALGGDFNAEELLHDYGVQFLTTLHSVQEVASALKIDHARATKLYAMLTLGRRLYAPNQSSLIRIRGIEDVYSHYRMLANLPKEQLWLLVINSRYQVIHEEVLAIGGTESLHISAKDVFQAAVERRATAVILLHNHPSGDPAPSKTDYEFTKKMRTAAEVLGIELLDHVVIASSGYQSCLQQVS